MLGTTKTFLIILILTGIVQGISEKFLTISVHQAALEHDFDTKIIGNNKVAGGRSICFIN